MHREALIPTADGRQSSPESPPSSRVGERSTALLSASEVGFWHIAVRPMRWVAKECDILVPVVVCRTEKAS